MNRVHYYRAENFESMTLIHYSGSSDLTNMLEAALIQSYNHISGCRNINLGGVATCLDLILLISRTWWLLGQMGVYEFVVD